MRHRTLWIVLGIIVVCALCATIVGLSVHIVDQRNERTARARESCRVLATNARELNAVLDYVKAAGASSPNPATQTFIAGLPYAKVPAC